MINCKSLLANIPATLSQCWYIYMGICINRGTFKPMVFLVKTIILGIYIYIYLDTRINGNTDMGMGQNLT